MATAIKRIEIFYILHIKNYVLSFKIRTMWSLKCAQKPRMALQPADALKVQLDQPSQCKVDLSSIMVSIQNTV